MTAIPPEQDHDTIGINTPEVLMLTLTRRTDQNGRVSLPKAFANTTVIIEQISDTELRIRKAEADELLFSEEMRAPLSHRDRDRFLDLLDNPPPANEALRKAAAEAKKHRD